MSETDIPVQKVLDRDSFHKEFSTEAYLKDFYIKVDDSAMQMVLTFLPNIVARIGKVKRVLDFGAGPTIHVAASFRQQADEIYLADYLPQNRQELERWYEGTSNFDWSQPLRMILTQEGNSWNDLDEMIKITRQKVCGIFHCDCLLSPSVAISEELQGTFDVGAKILTLVTIFCVEYCCKTYDEYKKAIRNIAEQIRDGGFFVMGGILEETRCSFGGRVFSCLYITKDEMLGALEEAGLHMESDRKCMMYDIDGMFMICARKRLF
ncbi:unnamed protein product [Angiostrongylus costaricensis]|uniref:NNMT/PNMT/TEMT family protein n=1 Tax=Angiostrongylus costaricensis TaxID=334426 RepID=A0A0R3PIY4_ANGCS|nr:unnamed protein product [Angiostrongylus costaricensis]